MIQISSIVEGDGEVKSLPILLRRLRDWKTPEVIVNALPPIRVRRDRFLNREDEFRKQLLLAAAKCGDGGWILIVLDADDSCPATLAAEVLARARVHVAHRKVSVVFANREFEAWFIAAARSLDGSRGFVFEDRDVIEAEAPRNAKKWVEARMAGSYRSVLDQPAFVARIDLQQAFDSSRSFRKLCKEWQVNIGESRPMN